MPSCDSEHVLKHGVLLDHLEAVTILTQGGVGRERQLCCFHSSTA
jgi:hypothetical protein